MKPALYGMDLDLGSCVCDINRDGWPDIYVGNDYISNDLLYVNQSDGTFKEMIKRLYQAYQLTAPWAWILLISIMMDL